MHNFFVHSTQLFGFGFLGIIVMAFIKMNDINKTNDTYTFAYVLKKFLNREWPAYGLSLTIILIFALSHEEWLPMFQDKVKAEYGVTLGIDLFMVLFGCVGQYFIYKKLGKIAKEPLPDQDIKP